MADHMKLKDILQGTGYEDEHAMAGKTRILEKQPNIRMPRTTKDSKNKQRKLRTTMKNNRAFNI